MTIVMARQRSKDIYCVSMLGAVANVLLVVLKFAAGLLGRSSAMVADAVHSLADCINDLVVILFVRLGSRPADETHSYGYGKYETLATELIGIVLLLVGIGVCWESVLSVVDFANGKPLESPHPLALIVAFLAVGIKGGVFEVMRGVGERWHSDAVIANAWHHLSDAMASICTVLGVGGAVILGPKWAVLDPLAAVFMGLIIIRMAVKLILKAVRELTEHSLPADKCAEIRRIVEAEDRRISIVKMQTRAIGDGVAIDLKLQMPAEMTFGEVSECVGRVGQKLCSAFGKTAQVCIEASEK